MLRGAPAAPRPGWAERLLDRFGSLPEVLGPSMVDLRREAPAAIALEIALLHDLQRRALAAPLRVQPVLGDLARVGDYRRTGLAAEGREQFRVEFLDRRHRLVRDEAMATAPWIRAGLSARGAAPRPRAECRGRGPRP